MDETQSEHDDSRDVSDARHRSGFPILTEGDFAKLTGRKQKVCQHHRPVLWDVDAALERAIHMLEKHQVGTIINRPQCS